MNELTPGWMPDTEAARLRAALEYLETAASERRDDGSSYCCFCSGLHYPGHKPFHADTCPITQARRIAQGDPPEFSHEIEAWDINRAMLDDGPQENHVTATGPVVVIEPPITPQEAQHFWTRQFFRDEPDELPPGCRNCGRDITPDNEGTDGFCVFCDPRIWGEDADA